MQFGQGISLPDSRVLRCFSCASPAPVLRKLACVAASGNESIHSRRSAALQFGSVARIGGKQRNLRMLRILGVNSGGSAPTTALRPTNSKSKYEQQAASAPEPVAGVQPSTVGQSLHNSARRDRLNRRNCLISRTFEALPWIGCKAKAVGFRTERPVRPLAHRRFHDRKETNKAGWVARTRPLAEPLSPRGPQPVVSLRDIAKITEWAVRARVQGTRVLVPPGELPLGGNRQ